MPTYTYRCSNCKHQFDMVQKFSDPPIERCPNCRRKAVHKVLHSPPIQFKGSGWYITDSKGSSSTPATSKSAKKKESASEPKPESAPPPKESGSE